MANPTNLVQTHCTDWEDDAVYWPLDTSTSATYYTGELMGRNASGYAVKFDDTAALEFIGVVFGIRVKVDSTDTNPVNKIRIRRPKWLTVPLATGTVGRAETNGAIGKLVYCQYSNTCQLDPSALTYANVLGRIVDIADSSSLPTALTSTVAVVVEPLPYKNTGGVRTLAATGNQTINVADIGKTILVPNTANLTLTLPAIAYCPIGGRLQFVKTTSTANSIVTLDGNANETIHNATTFTGMDAIDDTAELMNSGAEWIIISKNIS